MFNNVYKNRRVLVTGNTGFKGSWLAMWLLKLGAKVTGVSSYMPSSPCNFEVTNLKNRMNHIDSDVRELKTLKTIFNDFKPEIVFHLAAQAIVRRAHDDPKLTFDTNVGGTVNVMECVRTIPGVKAAVIITSDKCYENKEWAWGYRENDSLGGHDPYSASKACAEIVFRAYVESFFRTKNIETRIATARAGNVIGGGDWAQDRIIPDCVKAWSCGDSARIRNPLSTRPWQHVLEPLSGYLWLGANLFNDEGLHGESFNFGPDQKVNKSVKELIEVFISLWGDAKWTDVGDKNEKKKENLLLKLSCDKALHFLKWHSVLSFEDTVSFTAKWYREYYSNNSADMESFALEQIQDYVSKAISQGLPWVEGFEK